MKRAIISVSDKTGVADFAKALLAKGYEIISTGGTASLLAAEGVPTLEAEQVTGFPECLDGRVKTLHPKIHGGILAIRDNSEHMATLEKLDVGTIDLICVNLYPFKNTVAKPGHTLAEAVENIDIGGPSLIRAGSKNYKFVTVVTDAEDYNLVIENMDADGGVSVDTRFKLAAKAFQHTAAYDAYISQYLAKAAELEKFPNQLTLTFEKKQALRYGENGHQEAAYYTELSNDPACITSAECLSGKELSYNNIGDADGAIAAVKEFTEPCCVAVKHANPCAVAVGKDSAEAYAMAFAADPVSIFGGILAFNSAVNAECAADIIKTFIEIVIAPEYTAEALEILKTKKNMRVLLMPGVAAASVSQIEYKKVGGGLLAQDADNVMWDEVKTVTKTQPAPELTRDMEFAMKVCKHVKSNAIVIAKDGSTLGIGGGSVSRIWAAQAAIARAGDKVNGAVMASDAFFPFEDVVQECAKAGIAAIIQPGGSVNDTRSIEECDKNGIPMVFTGIRHFKH
ncbi:MAG: bifunctional phosphoribosylaminoimidazolecarboxamide formyltransferase/IMP cyclohydrolase [Oscillospiraceae bacterium]|nr:bifunctional phosphoribosylaminoimidazolecarboxamide formyltransferase/IMP cyclohydrolase [Oscillospiraceae bacterium]